MSTASKSTPRSAFGRAVAAVEETLIAFFLGMMTIVTFANVIARYVFNSNILWALETTVFLFAWLVLIGASYCVRINSHLGVDVVVNLLPPPLRKAVTLIAAGCSLAFAGLLVVGAWEYYTPFVGQRAWYEVNDIPMPDMLRFLEGWLNEGEEYEKMPRLIPYLALPLGMTLLVYRLVEASWKILQGDRDLLIASHEAEDMMEEAVAASDHVGAKKEG